MQPNVYISISISHSHATSIAWPVMGLRGYITLGHTKADSDKAQKRTAIEAQKRTAIGCEKRTPDATVVGTLAM